MPEFGMGPGFIQPPKEAYPAKPTLLNRYIKLHYDYQSMTDNHRLYAFRRLTVMNAGHFISGHPQF